MTNQSHEAIMQATHDLHARLTAARAEALSNHPDEALRMQTTERVVSACSANEFEAARTIDWCLSRVRLQCGVADYLAALSLAGMVCQVRIQGDILAIETDMEKQS